MISRTTENVASTDELTEAFKSLTEDGNKPYITASELYAAMPPDQVSYFEGYIIKRLTYKHIDMCVELSLYGT